MPSLREIRGRVKSVKATQQITKAMKMVSAAKLRKSQDRIIQARPYAYKLAELLASLSEKVDTSINPLFTKRGAARSVVLVPVTADRGLCGAFNTNVIKRTMNLINTEYADLNAAGKVKLLCVGRIGTEFFRKRGYPLVDSFPGIFGALQYGVAESIATTLSKLYLSEETDEVVTVYNEFKNVLSQNLRNEIFLPITPKAVPAATNPSAPSATDKKSKSSVEYIYEPSPDKLINALVPKHLAVQIWRVLLESNAAEQAARMSAMDSATENAKELLRTLNLYYNRARQAAITKEILEIVGGAEALKQSME